MAASDNENEREAEAQRAGDQAGGFVEFLSSITGVAQERLYRMRADVVARGEAARDEVRRNAFKTLFPDEATRIEEMDRRLDILEGKLAERDMIAGPRPDAQRRTGFSSTADFPDVKATEPRP